MFNLLSIARTSSLTRLLQHSQPTAKRTFASVLIPQVIDKDSNGYERSFDVYTRLLKDRIVFVPEVNSATANAVIAQLLYLESMDNSKPVKMYINSPGGSLYDAFAIYDTMNVSMQRECVIGDMW